MPRKLAWTEAQDVQIRRLRLEGASWDAIAASVGLNRWAVIERGRRIGARRPPPDCPPPQDAAREPLPPGHPISWNAITAGTVLEGSAYPLPVFSR